jgi:hypothetical protein
MPPAHWREVRFGDLLVFSSPVDVTPTGGTGVDTAFGEWRGEGLVVRCDYGLFVDPLTAHQNRSDARTSNEVINGHNARVVAVDQPGGSRFTAAHFPDVPKPGGGAAKLTFVVITSGQRTPAEAVDIVRSIRFTR